MLVENLAPKTDVIRLTSDDRYVTLIERDEYGTVYVSVTDTVDGSEMRMILGDEGYTHKI